ncbi:MAG: hypothetical protein AB1540_15715 [Bdellovibrionota bacterium]
MTTEKRQKDQLTVKNPKKAWRVIEDLMLDDEEMTIDELDTELRASGIDPDECVNKVFQAAERIARDPERSGRVSPHVSDILSQLSQRHRSEAKSAASDEQPEKDKNTRSTSAGGAQQAQAAVSSFYRNYEKTSNKDRQLLEKNEKRLQKKAKKLARKTRTSK